MLRRVGLASTVGIYAAVTLMAGLATLAAACFLVVITFGDAGVLVGRSALGIGIGGVLTIGCLSLLTYSLVKARKSAVTELLGLPFLLALASGAVAVLAVFALAPSML